MLVPITLKGGNQVLTILEFNGVTDFFFLAILTQTETSLLNITFNEQGSDKLHKERKGK